MRKTQFVFCFAKSQKAKLSSVLAFFVLLQVFQRFIQDFGFAKLVGERLDNLSFLR